jgi:hypothetical protein
MIKRFYKDWQGWFIDLPDYPGSKSDLAMVIGADTMLDIYAQGEGEVFLQIEENIFENCDRLDFLRHVEDIGGAYYQVNSILGIKYDFEVWLCDVTIYVFGYLPNSIYLRKI